MEKGKRNKEKKKRKEMRYVWFGYVCLLKGVYTKTRINKYGAKSSDINELPQRLLGGEYYEHRRDGKRRRACGNTGPFTESRSWRT